MKISASVRALYRELLPRYSSLMSHVDVLVQSRKERRWHYESRLKEEQSFALKLETGREPQPSRPEDFFACTIVVENQTRVAAAEELIAELFLVVGRRPECPEFAPLPAYSFDFDDLRLYVEWRDDPAQKPSGLNGLMFEFQIKTFLQHAWAVATHDLVYKTDEINWATSRIAYQVKAALENAELSISEARRLTEATMLRKSDRISHDLQALISAIRSRWSDDRLPKDLRRLALNISDLTRLLRISIDDLWICLDSATAAGEGAMTLDLSPHGAILAALLKKRGPDVLNPLVSAKKGRIFFPLEIELPPLQAGVVDRIVRPEISV